MPTIKDVAKLANVSISTVSYALSGNRKISDETRERVLEAAKVLDYKPSGIARSLKMKKNNIIAVVVNEFSGPIYPEIIRGISEATKKNNYEVIIAECFHSKTNITRVLSQRFVDGAIILASNINNSMVEELAGEGFPIVVLDREVKGDHVTSILIDNDHISYEVVAYFNGLGYQDIGFLSGPKDSYDNNTRYEGFKRGIKDFELNFQSKWYLKSNFTEEGGCLTMTKFIQEVPSQEWPRAFFVSNDEMALGALKALCEQGIEVPEQIALIGFDDIKLCEYVTPKLSTVRRPCYDLGVMAANSLITKLNGEKTSKVITLSSELIIRETCHKVV